MNISNNKMQFAHMINTYYMTHENEKSNDYISSKKIWIYIRQDSHKPNKVKFTKVPKTGH